jgi:hypothetical protein
MAERAFHFGNLTQPWPPDILCRMNANATTPRKIITAQNMEEAKTAAYANDPQTELVILGLGENPSVTTCGWVKRFFETRPSAF